MICSKCSSELPNDSDFCNKCGSRVMKNKDNGAFAYLCPKCKIPNPNSVTYCVKCGHWLLDSNFPAIPLTKKKYYKQLQGAKKRSPVLAIILYSLFGIIFFNVSVDVRVLLSLIIIIYGIVNIIVPIKALFIKKRLVGFAVLIIGILSITISSTSYTNSVNNLPSTGTAININEYKTQSVNISYDNLARNTEKYINVKANLSGQIIQVQESSNRLILRINITKGDYDTYKDTIWVNYTLKSGENHILENDVVNLWGTVRGRRTYKTVLGSEITLPEFDAIAIELKE